MRCNVYIDGFNFYYCCVKNTPYKWLDFYRLITTIYPRSTINRIRYFTAKIKPPPNDPQMLQRQETYLRALRTIPNLSIHLGQFRSHPVRQPIYPAPTSGPKTVQILKTEEKGSDVNLACYLLLDGFRNDYEIAVVVTNDSDLAEPVRMIREELSLSISILNPQSDKTKGSGQLVKASGQHVRRIRKSHLQISQFPIVLIDNNGEFYKPTSW